MESYKQIVFNVDGEMKIRDYLKNRLGVSTSLIAKVKYGGVLLNGNVVHMRAMVKNGDKIEIKFPSEDSEGIEPIDIPLEVLYEDKYILLVNKPRNMPIHPSRGNHLPTLANAVRYYVGHPFVFRSIMRLDRDTSGIVLIAKTQIASAKLSASMKRNEFEKLYLAKVVGVPKERSGIINAPIAREKEGEILRCVREDGKESITEYKTISIDSDGNAILEIRLLTGRTHQIRVHMAYIGHPLVNDFLYGERIEGETYRLHCKMLSFPHPETGERITVYSDCDFL